jgi:cytochrome c oxidase assembly protein subunit 15
MTAVRAAESVRPGRVRGWFGSATVLRRLAITTLVANVLIVVTGGAVRLTNSGLGCPTWPSCTSASLVPTRAYSFHGIIEFSNRQLTFVVGLLAVLTLLAAWAQRREVRLALVAFLGVPAQAVLGGITVLTDLNPYAVACHFLLSMAILFGYALLVWRLAAARTEAVPGPAVLLARVLAAVTAAVLVVGTVVTGSGPHAGDVKAGVVHRIHLSSAGISELHADAVMVLIGVTVGMLALCYALHTSERARRAVLVLLGVELAQGVIGFTQYFLHVPPLLVALHMFGACLVWLAAVRVLFTFGGIPGGQSWRGGARSGGAGNGAGSN